MNRYTIFKQTGTHADVMAAIGAADLLRHMDPQIVNFEDRFEVQLRRSLRRSDVDAVDPGFSYLLRPKKTAPGVPPERIVRTPATAGMPCVTTAENRMYSILGRLNAFGGPNQVISRFAGMKRQDWEASVWDCINGEPDFVFSSPLVQLFNPHAARGYALLKPNGTNRSDKTKNRWAAPFLEWLRFRGYFEGSAGWFASGDLRLFCPLPSDVSHAQFAATVAAFRELRLGGSAAKMDCRAVLGLTRLLIEKSETYRRPREWVTGTCVTHYKVMGQAHTFMGTEQLAIPDWFDLSTPQEEHAWLQALEEHDTVLRRLTDSHSDEFMLLKQYRRTFQTRWQESIAAFVEFLASYGTLLFKRRAKDHWLLPQFTLSGVTLILERDPNLWALLHNPGFLAVAAAVRGATVGAQAARRRNSSDYRQIRYGLPADIQRAELLGRRELMAVVSAFIHDFNREASQRHGTGLRAAHIQNVEMAAFADAVGTLPLNVAAGSLLCGLASCVRNNAAVAEIEPELAQAIPA